MLKTHMDCIEEVLVAKSSIQESTGHSLHKGTPREAFISEFLQSHLAEHVAIGTGEIIDAASQPRAPRNQYDIVIYKKNYPKLDFGGGINGFFIESVIATIEVKSTLTEKDLSQAIKAANNSKQLKPSLTNYMRAGFIPPKILNFVIAYKGPKKVETILKWITKIHKKMKISNPALSLNESERERTPSTSLDGVFILRKGFIQFDNNHLALVSPSTRAANANAQWTLSNTEDGNLLLFFLLLTTATLNLDGRFLNPIPYVSAATIANLQMGTE